MNPKSIHLEIPKPCHEDWAKMTPDEQGRHCAACDKVVLDMRHWSDQKLINLFQNKEERVCGRLKKEQMHRPLMQPSPSFLPRWGAALLIPFSFLFVQAQYESPKLNTPFEVVKQTDHLFQLGNDTGSKVLKCRLVDSLTGDILVGGTVVIYKNGVVIDGKASGIDGEVVFYLPSGNLDSLLVKVSYIGYLTKEFYLKDEDLNRVKIIALDESNLVLGGIGSVVYVPHKKWWQFWK